MSRNDATRHFKAREYRAGTYLPQLLVELADMYATTPDAIMSTSRALEPRTARMVAYWVLREAGLSLPGIGRLMGRDHSTVLSGCRRVEADDAYLDPAWDLAKRFARTERAA